MSFNTNNNPNDKNKFTFVYSPFFQQGTDDAYNRIPHVAEACGMDARDLQRASEVVAGLEADGESRHLCVSINMSSICTVRLPPDVPFGTKNFFAHRASVIMQDRLGNDIPSVQSYQAFVQLIPRPVSCWAGTRPLKRYEEGLEKECLRKEEEETRRKVEEKNIFTERRHRLLGDAAGMEVITEEDEVYDEDGQGEVRRRDRRNNTTHRSFH